MTIEPDTELLTIAEAARLLRVSRVTLHRWLKAGRLPAYHVGPKAVRIRRGDLDAVITPAHQERAPSARETLPESMPIHTSLATITPPTAEEIERTFAALAAARELGVRIRERLGDQPFDESWPIIREKREEREQSRRL